MRVRTAVAAFLFGSLIALAAAAGADDAAAPADGPLAAVAPYVGGEWTIDGKWKNGEALKAREVFTWGLGNKFVEVRTWVSRDDGSGEYERYRGIFAVKDGKLVSYNFAYDGRNTLDDVSVEGNVLKIRRAVTDVDAPTVIHQELERAGDDKFKWRVWLERDGKKDQIMDGEWVRRKDAPRKPD
jgi:hypothetical protein